MNTQLPNEIWIMILKRLDKSDWKHVRLSCNLLSALTTPILFETVYFELCGSGCISLFNIATHSSLSRHVKTLVLRRVQGYRKFPDSRTWAQSVHQPGDPGHELEAMVNATHYHNTKASEGLLPYSAWVSLSDAEKDALYNEYEADRQQMQDHVHDMTSQLHFHMPDFKSMPIHPYRAWSRRAAGNPAHLFTKALTYLQNLKTFRHEPGFLFDPGWCCRWRHLYFHPFALLIHTSDFEDEDVEALQLSVALQTLAFVQNRHGRLQSMSMFIGGPSFWGTKRLQHLWDSGSHERTRRARRIYSTAAEADQASFSRYTNSEENRIYFWQLCLLKHAVAELSELDCSVSENDDCNGSLAIAQRYLRDLLLSPAAKLERLRLVFGRLRNGTSAMREDDPQYAQDSIMLLTQLALCTPWKKLRSIELELATDSITLKRFLFAHTATLRSLSLVRVTLVRLDDPRNNWESTLEEIAEHLSLETLTLAKLCDFVPQKDGQSTERRILFDMEAQIWHSSACQYQSYYRTAIERLLCGQSVRLM